MEGRYSFLNFVVGHLGVSRPASTSAATASFMARINPVFFIDPGPGKTRREFDLAACGLNEGDAVS